MREATLYAVPASHPCATVMKALELKGVAYRRVDLVPAVHRLAQKARFGGAGTVPGIVFADGRKVLGSRAILRDLDAQRPDPPLYPPDGAGVEEAEAWGDAVLQQLARRVAWQALSVDTGAQLTYLEGASLFPPVPRAVAKASGGAVAWIERRLNASTPAAVAADLAALPGHVDRVDAWNESGTLGGERPQRRRPPDRRQPAPAAHARRPRAADRPPTGGGVSPPLVSRLPRARPRRRPAGPGMVILKTRGRGWSWGRHNADLTRAAAQRSN